MIRQQYFNVSASIDSSTLRQSLENLIQVKNEVPRYNMQLQPVTNTYHPEDPNYMQGIIYMVFVIMFTGGLFVFAFVVFAVCRVCFKRCGGSELNEQEIEEFNPDRRSNYVAGVVFLAIFLIGCSAITLIGDIGYFQSALESN